MASWIKTPRAVPATEPKRQKRSSILNPSGLWEPERKKFSSPANLGEPYFDGLKDSKNGQNGQNTKAARKKNSDSQWQVVLFPEASTPSFQRCGTAEESLHPQWSPLILFRPFIEVWTSLACSGFFFAISFFSLCLFVPCLPPSLHSTFFFGFL